MDGSRIHGKGVNSDGQLFGWGRKVFIGLFEDGKQFEPTHIPKPGLLKPSHTNYVIITQSLRKSSYNMSHIDLNFTTQKFNMSNDHYDVLVRLRNHLQLRHYDATIT